MLTKYDPYENSKAERINGTLKTEFFIGDRRMTKKEMQLETKRTIKVYNEKRPHMSCELMVPNEAHTNGRFKMKQWGRKPFNKK